MQMHRFSDELRYEIIMVCGAVLVTDSQTMAANGIVFFSPINLSNYSIKQ